MQTTLNIKKIGSGGWEQINNLQRAINFSGRRLLLNKIGNKFLSWTRSTFGSSGGGFRGNDWPRYSKRYAKKVGSTTPTLLRSGALRQSIKLGVPRGNFIEIKSDTPYSAAQFLGNPKNNLPARRYMPIEQRGKNMFRFTLRAERELVNEISKHLTFSSGGAWPRITSLSQRSSFEQGNPKTAASPSSDTTKK